MATPKLTTNTLIRQVDLPTWEWIRQMPAVSSALSSGCASHSGNFHETHGRYSYWMVASISFWRYDSWTDGWQQLSSSPATVTMSDLEFLSDYGPEGRVISATATTVQLAGFYPQGFESFEIRITGGTGKGQRRIISLQNDPVVADSGVATAIATGGILSITDSTKNWIINQWVGYTVRISSGQGVGQSRRIIYNDSTTITFGDTGRYSNDTTAYPQVMNLGHSATAGSQSKYSIESSVCTVATWQTTPDATSRYKVMTGAIIWVSGTSGSSVQLYVIGEDNWYFRASQTTNVFSTAGSETRVEGTPETDFIQEASYATAGTTTTLTDSLANWVTNEWVERWVLITEGTGEGQIRKISANTQTQLTWVTVGTAPTTTSRYSIEGLDAGTATSGAASTLTDTAQAWTTDQYKNQMVYIVAGTGIGQSALIASNTSTVLTLRKAWTQPSYFMAAGVAPDSTSVYMIAPDSSSYYVSHHTNAAIVRQSLHNGIWFCGNKITDGLALGAAARYGEFPAVNIVTATGTTTITVTTSVAHGFRTGFIVTMSGDTGAGAAANNVSAAITVTGATTFTYTGSATNAWTIVSGQGVTTIKDSTKSWTVNEHANRIVRFNTTVLSTAGLQSQVGMEISSNTANTLTFKGTAGGAPTLNTSAYVICTRDALGSVQNGVATGAQTTTTLQDTDKSATYTGSVTGTVLTVTVATIAGLQVNNVVTGTGITAGSIIMSLGTGTGGTGTYNLSASSTATGSITVTGGWVSNQYAGMRARMLTATGGGEAVEALISSNTNNTLTLTAFAIAPVTTVSSYVILPQILRGFGSTLDFAATPSRSSKRGRYLFSLRAGGVPGIDRFDIVTNEHVAIHIGTIHNELWATGTMSAYDNKDRIYFTLNVTQRCLYFDIVKGAFYGFAQYPYVAGTTIVGNRMIIIETKDRLKFLILNRHSNVEMFRTLLME